jgi:hypothetical protein
MKKFALLSTVVISSLTSLFSPAEKKRRFFVAFAFETGEGGDNSTPRSRTKSDCGATVQHKTHLEGHLGSSAMREFVKQALAKAAAQEVANRTTGIEVGCDRPLTAAEVVVPAR